MQNGLIHTCRPFFRAPQVRWPPLRTWQLHSARRQGLGRGETSGCAGPLPLSLDRSAASSLAARGPSLAGPSLLRSRGWLRFPAPQSLPSAPRHPTVSPSHRLTVSPSHHFSISPFLHFSIPPSHHPTIPPSLRPTVPPSHRPTAINHYLSIFTRCHNPRFTPGSPLFPSAKFKTALSAPGRCLVGPWGWCWWVCRVRRGGKYTWGMSSRGRAGGWWGLPGAERGLAHLGG